MTTAVHLARYSVYVSTAGSTLSYTYSIMCPCAAQNWNCIDGQ